MSNLKFGLHMEPNNENLKNKLEEIQNRRKENQPSVPSTIGNSLFVSSKLEVMKLFVETINRKKFYL